MNFKKLSLAAALSIGIMTVNGIANAACPCAQQAIPACPAAIQQAPCPCQEQAAACPTCKTDPCACAAPCAPQVVLCNPITGVVPNLHPNAKVYERQAFAFPNIGSSTVVMPKGQGLLQIGGEQESIALGNDCPTGLSAVSGMGGALTLYPKMTGAAAPFAPVCPNQVMQGTDILRCNIPNATKVLQSNYFDQRFTGAAMQIGGACAPCNPCAAPAIAPCGPCGAAAPCALPCDPCAAPAIAPCGPCGAAAQLTGCPITINTSSGLQLQKTILVPGAAAPLGCACPVTEQYPDVTNNMIAGCDINTLTTAGVLAGYPDRYYKPCQPLLRSELAAAIVHGFNLDGVPAFSQQIFKDVSTCHWAKADIDKVYNRGIMTGDSCDRFRPEDPATNAETLSALAKFIPATMAACDVQSVLQKYSDSCQLPTWAKASVAQALNAGAIKDLPDSCKIKPNDNTQRTDVATIIRSLRQKLCLEAPAAKTIGAACPCSPQTQIISQTIPTLKVQMEDLVTARTSLINDRFVAKTIEPVTINGQNFPCGSEVRGKVVEVIRPGMGDAGGIRLGFDTIGNGSCKVHLPNDILSATVIKEKNPNIVGRIAAWPFTWTGKVAGIVGRTAGGGVTIVGDATEGILNNFGNGNNELFNGKFKAAGRSYISSGREAVMGVYDVGKTAFSGVAGVLKESGDEVAYVVSPDGSRIAQINPRENISIAFGACNTCNTACK